MKDMPPKMLPAFPFTLEYKTNGGTAYGGLSKTEFAAIHLLAHSMPTLMEKATTEPGHALKLYEAAIEAAIQLSERLFERIREQNT